METQTPKPRRRKWLLILLAGAAGGWLTAQVLKILEGGDGTC